MLFGHSTENMIIVMFVAYIVDDDEKIKVSTTYYIYFLLIS